MTPAKTRLPLRIATLVALVLPAIAQAHDGVGSWFALPPTLAGTTWAASDVTGQIRYHFQPDGTLEYVYPNGRALRNATWKQEGSKLYMEFNHKYSERSATILGDRIVGEGWNKRGGRWLWDAHKTPRPD